MQTIDDYLDRVQIVCGLQNKLILSIGDSNEIIHTASLVGEVLTNINGGDHSVGFEKINMDDLMSAIHNYKEKLIGCLVRVINSGSDLNEKIRSNSSVKDYTNWRSGIQTLINTLKQC